MTTTTPDTAAPEDVRLRILGLQVENFKRIRLVELHPDGRSLVIGGRNAQGKSSLLDGIAAAVAGAKRSPQVPLRTGAVRGKVEVDLGEYRVTRSWTSTSDKLVVVDRAGVPQKSPQRLLDALIADISFDPLSFVRSDGKAQATMLRQLTGLDTADLDAERLRVYAERTALNGEAKRSEVHRDSIILPPRPADPMPRPSVTELLAERARLVGERDANAAARRAFDELARNLRFVEETASNATARVDALTTAAGMLALYIARAVTVVDAARAAKEAINHAPEHVEVMARAGEAIRAAVDAVNTGTANLDRVRVSIIEEEEKHGKASLGAALLTEDVAKRRAMIEQLADPAPDTISAIDAKLAAADEMATASERAGHAVEDWKRLAARRRDAEEAVERLRIAAQVKTDRLAAIDAERTRRLGEAHMPVAGLGIEGDMVTYNGRPLEQASQAEQVIVGLSIGAALNPRCAFILVREGAFLDDANLQVALAWAAERKLQLILETVGNREGVGVVIEDGRVAIEEQPAATPAGGAA